LFIDGPPAAPGFGFDVASALLFHHIAAPIGQSGSLLSARPLCSAMCSVLSLLLSADALHQDGVRLANETRGEG
jgi:hypothetical protein